MRYQPTERLEMLLEGMRTGPWQHRFDDPRWQEQWDHWLDRAEHWLKNDLRYSATWEYDRTPQSRIQLERIEAKLDALLREPARCNAPSDFGERFPNFMTALTAINDGNLAVGKTAFRAHLAG